MNKGRNKRIEDFSARKSTNRAYVLKRPVIIGYGLSRNLVKRMTFLDPKSTWTSMKIKDHVRFF